MSGWGKISAPIVATPCEAHNIRYRRDGEGVFLPEEMGRRTIRGVYLLGSLGKKIKNNGEEECTSNRGSGNSKCQILLVLLLKSPIGILAALQGNYLSHLIFCLVHLLNF